MAKITDYMIVTESQAWDLQNKVQEMINSGWQPYGDLVFHYEEFASELHQPMVKTEDDTKG